MTSGMSPLEPWNAATSACRRASSADVGFCSNRIFQSVYGASDEGMVVKLAPKG